MEYVPHRIDILSGRHTEIAMLLLLVQTLRIPWYLLAYAHTSVLISMIILIILATPFSQDPFKFCASPFTLGCGDYLCLFTSHFIHVNAWHAYHNLSSFLRHAVPMEYKIGNTRFFKLVVVLLSRCIVLHILLNYILFQVSYNSAYANDCYLGISSLGFALNTLSILSSCEKYVIALPYGLTVRVPKYVFSSFDMLFLQLPLPTSSLNGHLAGIIAGLSYLKSYSSLLVQNRNHQPVEDLSE